MVESVISWVIACFHLGAI